VVARDGADDVALAVEDDSPRRVLVVEVGAEHLVDARAGDARAAGGYLDRERS
jgi:hypothetical protein